MSNHAAKDREPLKQSRPSPSDRLADRKQRFEKIVTEAARKNAWVTSVSGAELVTFDALEGSPLAADLRERGFDVIDEGWGERILAVAVTDHVKISADSSAVRRVTHAGVAEVRKWVFNLD
jgi:hypothetical protein